jgi:mannonate dehydratase
MRRPLVPNRVWRLAAAFTLAGITVAQNAGRTSGPGSPTQKQASENLRTGLGISVASDEVLRVAVQLGVRDVVIYGGPGSGKVPGTDRKLTKPRAGYQDYLELRQRLESHGLRLAAIEGGFVHLAKYRDIVFGGPRRDELIDELAAEIRDMGRAGVPAYGYNWMASLVWRTKPVRIRGGAEATAFNYADVKDVQDREGCEAARKALNWFLMTCENTPARGEKKPTEETMWRNLEYWIRKITPIAERAGIRLGIHPDDPPVSELAGVPRLMRNHAAYKRLLSIYPSRSNAIEFCQGTFSEMKDDVYEAIRYFGSRDRILYVHFRNVSGKVPRFHEEFINTGYVDMAKAVRLYREAGFRGVLIDDHVPRIAGDKPFPGNLGGYRSRMFAVGYIESLIDASAPQTERAGSTVRDR